MKYLRTKHSRRRGVAIELAMMLLLVMTAMSIMLVSTTMIQINKQKESTSDLTEIVDEIKKMEYDNVGKYFKQLLVQNINTTNENDIVTVDYITTKINEKYSTYFNERNVEFVIETNTTSTSEGFENEDQNSEQVVEQKNEVVTYLDQRFNPINIDQSQPQPAEEQTNQEETPVITYVSHEVTVIKSVTGEVTKVSGTNFNIIEDFTLKILEKKENNEDISNVLYEITISRTLHKTETITVVDTYEKVIKEVTTTIYHYGKDIIYSNVTAPSEEEEISNTPGTPSTSYSFIVTENDYSITNVEIK